MVKRRHLLCMVLTAAILFSSVACFLTTSSSAAAGDILYLQAPSGWSDLYCYAWKGTGGSGNQNAAWPGERMQPVTGNLYSVLLQSDYTKVIFSNNGDNQTQTEDLDYPGNNMVYVYQTKQWAPYTGTEVPSQPQPAENLVQDPSFENGDGFWSFSPGIAVTGDKPHTGSKSAKSTVRGLNAVTLFSSRQIAVTPHTDYRLAGYIYRGDDSAWAYLDMNDMPGELQVRDTVFGKWQYVTGIWNSGDNTSVQLRGVVEKNYYQNTEDYQGIACDIWFDDISFTPVVKEAYTEQPPVLSEQAQTWTLENKEMKLQVAVDQNKQYITSMINKTNNINWIDTATASPMLEKVSGKDISWQFQSAKVDHTEGTTLTLVFLSAVPALELQSVWEIQAQGPVYHYSTLANHTNAQITVDSEDVVASDVLLHTNDPITVYRFNRSRFNNGLDAQFSTGVLTQTAKENLYLRTPVENAWETSTGVLPFQLLQSENGHGFYFGYEWSYGEILTRTQENRQKIKMQATLGEVKETVTRDTDQVFTVPPVFYGVYTGSPDNGSNAMKQWFWKYKMTPTLRENEAEPPIELHVPTYSEAGLTHVLDTFKLDEWGVGLVKMDYWWTVPSDSAFQSFLEQQWLPDPGKWPNGMTYSSIIKNKYPGVQASLYMCDTYKGVDIGTKQGRNAQIAALSQRIEDWGIDYWRSDFDLEQANSYASHEGLLYILDTLSQQYDNFRYEHCSAGGALKDFSTLKRMTFMTMEDSGGALNHRMAFYANSYMINPLQLKFDVGFDWTSDHDRPLIEQNRQEWAYYVLRTAMMGSMMACAVGREMTPTEIQAAKDCYALYNSRQRAILRGADVYHILPMPDGVNWDGMQFYNEDLQQGSVFLFKNSQSGGSDGTQKTIHLDGLKENASYTVDFEDRKSLSCTKTGKELMEDGITVTGMTNVYDSEIIWITCENGGADDLILGDVDNDGTVSISDVLETQKSIAKMIALTEKQQKAADVNKDEAVTLDDVILIQKKIAHLIQDF